MRRRPSTTQCDCDYDCGSMHTVHDENKSPIHFFVVLTLVFYFLPNGLPRAGTLLKWSIADAGVTQRCDAQHKKKEKDMS